MLASLFMQCLEQVQTLFSLTFSLFVWSAPLHQPQMAVHMAPRCGLPSCFGKTSETESRSESDWFQRLERLLCWVVRVWLGGAVGICNANGEICWSHQHCASLILHLSSPSPAQRSYGCFSHILTFHIYHYYCKSCRSGYAFNLVKVDKILALFCPFPASVWLVCKMEAWSWC